MAASCSDPHVYSKTVIFCKRKETICSVYQYLKVSSKSAYITMYQASISDETKEHVFSLFVSGCLCVLVSTIAFGMVGLLVYSRMYITANSNVVGGHPRHTSSDNVWFTI